MRSRTAWSAARTGLTGHQAGAMGESWSDLTAVEYLHEYGFVPVGGENPFAVGPYVTGDQETGIRNYGMNESPLNYSDVGYDFVCNGRSLSAAHQVHADGEIWSATNYRPPPGVHRHGYRRHGCSALRRGRAPADQCPGNRRWIQIVFDAFLLSRRRSACSTPATRSSRPTQLRFNGANQAISGTRSPSAGSAQAAVSTATTTTTRSPSFDSPYANEATVTFRPVGNAARARRAPLYVGQYEARATPVADTDGDTARDDGSRSCPGTYELVRARGYGHVRPRSRSGRVRS